MKIVYRQSDAPLPGGGLSGILVKDCLLKKLSQEKDRKITSRKMHHHTHYEVHILIKGSQEYEVEGCCYKVEAGQFLLIAPECAHRICASSRDALKYAVTFRMEPADVATFCGALQERIRADLGFVEEEARQKKELSPILTENCMLEIVVMLLRQAGRKEREQKIPGDEKVHLTMARQYIRDNIESAPTVEEVAKYCYLSSKQLTRLFLEEEDVTPGEYIRKTRGLYAEKLLCDASLSLREISERMNFASEYYFNSFFKKHAGMPPGEYRKSFVE